MTKKAMINTSFVKPIKEIIPVWDKLFLLIIL
jgi:hypothetical protein